MRYPRRGKSARQWQPASRKRWVGSLAAAGISETPGPGGALAGGAAPLAKITADTGGALAIGGLTLEFPPPWLPGSLIGGSDPIAKVTTSTGGALAGGTAPTVSGVSETPGPGGAVAGGNTITVKVTNGVGGSLAGGAAPPAKVAILPGSAIAGGTAPATSGASETPGPGGALAGGNAITIKVSMSTTATTFVQDSFTDTDATLLSSHTPGSGGPWVQHSGSVTTAEIASNRLRRATGGTAAVALYYATGTPDTAEYDVETDFIPFSIGTVFTGIAGRMDTSVVTLYLARYNGTQWELMKAVAGTFTSLGTSTATLTLSQSYHVKLQIRDAAKKLFVDGVELISSADNAVTAAGKAGVRMADTASGASAGIHLDNFLATNSVAANVNGAIASGNSPLSRTSVTQGGSLAGGTTPTSIRIATAQGAATVGGAGPTPIKIATTFGGSIAGGTPPTDGSAPPTLPNLHTINLATIVETICKETDVVSVRLSPVNEFRTATPLVDSPVKVATISEKTQLTPVIGITSNQNEVAVSTAASVANSNVTAVSIIP